MEAAVEALRKKNAPLITSTLSKLPVLSGTDAEILAFHACALDICQYAPAALPVLRERVAGFFELPLPLSSKFPFRSNRRDGKHDTHVGVAHVAAFFDSHTTLEYILEVGPPRLINDATRVDMHTPLHYAVAGGALEAVRVLLTRGAIPGAEAAERIQPIHIICDTISRPPKIETAVRRQMMSLLIEAGAHADARNSQHTAALWLACSRPRASADIVSFLLDRGASVDHHGRGPASNFLPRTPLHMACKLGNVPVVQALLAGRAQVAKAHGALSVAVETGDIDLVMALLGAGAQWNDGDPPAIYVACERGDSAIVNLLLDKATDFRSLPLLCGAARRDHLDVAQLLVDRGLSPQGAGDGKHPLLYAAASGGSQVAKLLLSLGADVHVRDASGKDMVVLAAEAGCAPVIRMALDKGLSVQGTPEHRPLLYAAGGLHLRATQLLLDRGANPNARDTTDRTAVHALAGKGTDADAELLRLLLLWGCDPRHKALGTATANLHGVLRDIAHVWCSEPVDLRLPPPVVDYTTFKHELKRLLIPRRDHHAYPHCDLSLVCEGGQVLKTSRALLAACDPFFESLVTKNPEDIIEIQNIPYTVATFVVNHVVFGTPFPAKEMSLACDNFHPNYSALKKEAKAFRVKLHEEEEFSLAPVEVAIEPENIPEHTMQALSNLVNNGDLCSDIRFIVQEGSRVVFAHQLLATRCPMLRAMLAKDSERHIVNLHDISFDAMFGYLEFLYTGTIAGAEKRGHVAAVFPLCHRFRNAALKAQCELHLARRITPANVAALYTEACKLECPYLERECLFFVLTHKAQMETIPLPTELADRVAKYRRRHLYDPPDGPRTSDSTTSALTAASAPTAFVTQSEDPEPEETPWWKQQS